MQEMPAEYSVSSVVTGGDENRVTGLLAKKRLIPSVVKSIQNKHVNEYSAAIVIIYLNKMNGQETY